MSIQLSDATVTVNNNTVAIVPNSLIYTEGKGEQTMRAASVGGGTVEQVYANNVETSLSKCNFDLMATIDNIDLAREWKVNLNQNLVQVTGTTPDGKKLSRTFTQAAVLNDYEVALGSDTNITIEFMSNPAV